MSQLVSIPIAGSSGRSLRRLALLSTNRSVAVTSERYGWDKIQKESNTIRRTQSSSLVLLCSKRYFAAVKELSWCAPSASPNKRKSKTVEIGSSSATANTTITTENDISIRIIAAMSRNRIIGIHGKLPWVDNPCLEDREIFKKHTKDKILILGRKTFEEEANLSHISHSRACIVVSASLLQEQRNMNEVEEAQLATNSNNSKEQIPCSSNSNAKDLETGTTQLNNIHANHISLDYDNTKHFQIKVVSSFPEALDVARIMENRYFTSENECGRYDKDTDDEKFKEDCNVRGGNAHTLKNDKTYIPHCWVVGGERLYEEALRHPKAQEIHLSVFNVDIDVDNLSRRDFSMFPAKYRWDRKFKEVSRKEINLVPASGHENDKIIMPNFIYSVFKRK